MTRFPLIVEDEGFGLLLEGIKREHQMREGTIKRGENTQTQTIE